VENNKGVVIVLFVLFIGLTIVYAPFLSPALAFIFFMYIAYPYRATVPVKRLMVAASILFILWLWKEIGAIMAPFATALFLAYLLDPVIDLLERKKFKRPLAVGLVLGGILGLFLTMFLLIIPRLIDQITVLISNIQTNQQQITSFFENNWDKLKASGLIDTEKLTVTLQEFSNRISGEALKAITNISGVFKYALNLIIIPVVTFYLLRDYDIIREWIFGQVPHEKRTRIETGYNNFNTIFGRYIRGVVLDSSIVGLLTFIILTILGIPFALFIGIVTMFFNVMPYIGIWISVAFALITVLISGGDGTMILKLAIGYGIVQLMEQLVIYPKIMGKMIGFHSVFIMIMLLTLSHFWGLFGLIIGIPITAFVWYYIQIWLKTPVSEKAGHQ